MRTIIKTNLAGDERGSVAIVFALTAFALFSIVGLAIDMGRSTRVSAKLQGALDAAVLAGANVSTEKQTATASAVFAANFSNAAGLSADFVTLTFSQDGGGQFGGTASVTVPTTFAGIAGVDGLTISLQAKAKNTAVVETETTWDETVTTTTPGPLPCILALDPSAASAFKLISNSNLNASTCEVDVRSDDTYAMYNDSTSQATFKHVRVNGGVRHIGGGRPMIAASPNKVEVGKEGSSGLSSWVVKNNPTVNSDPFGSAISTVISSTTVGDCTAANSNKSWSGTVDPGTYCGITTFSGATFNTGTYVIKSISGGNTGQLKLTGLLKGSAGVSFFLSDNSATLVQYAAAEGSTLYAPSTGPSKGLLFFENSNRSSKWSVSIANTNKQAWKGLIYLPSANVSMKSLSEWPSLYVSMVVNTLYMDSLSTVFTPFPWTPWFKTTAISYPGTTTTTTVSHTSTSSDTKSGWLLR